MGKKGLTFKIKKQKQKKQEIALLSVGLRGLFFYAQL